MLIKHNPICFFAEMVGEIDKSWISGLTLFAEVWVIYYLGQNSAHLCMSLTVRVCVDLCMLCSVQQGRNRGHTIDVLCCTI